MNNTPRTNRERSPWAIISVLIVIILFGLFWLWQKQTLQKQNIFIIPTTDNTAETTNSPEDSLFDFSTLEASVVSTPIPYFSEVF